MTNIIIPEAKWLRPDCVIFGQIAFGLKWKYEKFTLGLRLKCSVNGGASVEKYKEQSRKRSKKRLAAAKAKRAEIRAAKAARGAVFVKHTYDRARVAAHKAASKAA